MGLVATLNANVASASSLIAAMSAALSVSICLVMVRVLFLDEIVSILNDCPAVRRPIDDDLLIGDDFAIY